MVSLYTSNYSLYEDMKSGAKCRNWVVWDGWGSLKVIGNVTSL